MKQEHTNTSNPMNIYNCEQDVNKQDIRYRQNLSAFYWHYLFRKLFELTNDDMSMTLHSHFYFNLNIFFFERNCWHSWYFLHFSSIIIITLCVVSMFVILVTRNGDIKIVFGLIRELENAKHIQTHITVMSPQSILHTHQERPTKWHYDYGWIVSFFFLDVMIKVSFMFRAILFVKSHYH